ncbi:MAG: ABC transporter ATP-binding protein [Rhizobiaceae bacterium]
MFAWFEKLIDPFPVVEPTEPPAKLWLFIWHYTRGIWPALAVVSALSVVAAVVEIWIFSFFGNLVDWLSGSDRTTFLADEGGQLILMTVVVLGVYPLIAVLHNLVVHQTVIGNYPMIIRWMAHRYVLGQSMSFYQDEFAGRVATKVMQAALGVRETVMKTADIFVYVSVYFLGALVLVSSLSVWLMTPFLVWFAGYAIILRYFMPRMRVISERQADARSEMTGRVVDSYTNIMTVKLFAHSKLETDYARDSMEGFLNTVHPQMRLVTLLNIALVVLNYALLYAIAAIGIWSWLDSAVSAGAVAIAIGLVLRLNGMSHWIMWELSGLFENLGMAIDGMNTVAQPRLVRDEADAGKLAASEGRIEYDHVRFHYGKEKGVIEDLSLTVKPGEKIGLVGRSGAGKSTLVNLLLRFYDLERGRITIDGQDISKVSQDSLRGAIGMVSQDTSLLHRSLRENIAYGRHDATEDMIMEAVRRAEADSFIDDLEDPKGRRGLDAHVGERGVKLSGGQRQRIAIARVMLKDAPILILDEATSALDSEVEAAIQENLYRLMEGKTVIAIAHRLSTIAALDRLIVMDNGEIIEQGTHDELVAKGGLYAQLWERQSGGFLIHNEAEAGVAAE